MKIFAAIDLKGGQCVRLEQRDPNRKTVYGEEPAKFAETWEAVGTDWLHVVNLDGAFSNKEKTVKNIDALQAILDRVSVPVQFGGGLRSLDDIETALDMGVSRVMIGSIAVDRSRQLLDILAKFGPDRVALGLDIEDGKVAAHGWRELTVTDPIKLAQLIHTAGVRHVIHTDIAREGLLTGANVEASVALARAGNPDPGASRRFEVVVSGGVASLEDVKKIKAVADQGIEGVVIGTALYTGDIDLAEAASIAHSD
jgi:phosphoribosylformimino-5-aminoimidazole carboxamide ribotide isomerase